MKIDWKKAYDLLFKVIENDTVLNEKEFYFLFSEIDNSIIRYKDFVFWKTDNDLNSKKAFYWDLINRLSEEHKFDFFCSIVDWLDKKQVPDINELKFLFNQSILKKEAQKTSFNFFKKTDTALLMATMFFIRILKTFFDFVFFPRKFAESIEIEDNGDVTIENDDYEQPLIYLLFFTILCAIYGYVATNTQSAQELLLEDRIFKPFISILGSVWTYVQELEWSKLFIVMIPLVLFTVLYAISMTLISKVLKLQTSFKTNLYLCSYYFGTYLFLHGLLFSYTMIMGSFVEKITFDILAILMLIWHLIIILFILKNFYAFLVIVKLKICNTFKSTLLFITISTILFILIFIPLGIIIYPFFII